MTTGLPSKRVALSALRRVAVLTHGVAGPGMPGLQTSPPNLVLGVPLLIPALE